MVKLRRNHSRSKAFGGRLLILVVGASIALSWFIYRLDEILDPADPKADLGTMILTEDPRWYLPSTTTDQIIFHDHYSLSYNEALEQAEWVAYRLTAESLKLPNVPRTDWYETDPAVVTGSAHYRDYSNSNYTRGHLVPAGDMAFSEEAMESTFFMSNISPQARSFNGGIWRELEEQVREWTLDRGELVIISGPVFQTDINERIGKNKVAVPDSFYKIIYNENRNLLIAFLIPNEKSEEKLEEYMVSVDSIEAITGIDFFANLFTEENDYLESVIEKEDWNFNQNRYRIRISEWNNR